MTGTYLTLAEIRRRLGLDEYDAFSLWQLRDAYRKSRHAPLLLTDLHGPRPFTVADAIGYGERVAHTELRP